MRLMVNLMFGLVWGILLLCAIGSIWLGIDLAGEIKEVGLKGVLEQVWNGSEGKLSPILKDMR